MAAEVVSFVPGNSLRIESGVYLLVSLWSSFGSAILNSKRSDHWAASFRGTRCDLYRSSSLLPGMAKRILCFLVAEFTHFVKPLRSSARGKPIFGKDVSTKR